MNDLTESLKTYLKENGASLVGIGNLNELDLEIRKGMPIGICIAVAIPAEIIEGISLAPTIEYYNTYYELNEKLDFLATIGAEYLKGQGYEACPQTRAIVSEKQGELYTILPHKTIATRAGVGWIGKCALLVTNKYGSAIRITTILTNAPLKADLAVNESNCMNCMNCTDACPGNAVKGVNWNIDVPREDIFDPVKCRQTARKISMESIDKEITLCGKCISVCPYTQKYIKENIGAI